MSSTLWHGGRSKLARHYWTSSSSSQTLWTRYGAQTTVLNRPLRLSSDLRDAQTVKSLQVSARINEFAYGLRSVIPRASARFRIECEPIAGTLRESARIGVMQPARNDLCREDVDLRFTLRRREINAADETARKRNRVFARIRVLRLKYPSSGFDPVDFTSMNATLPDLSNTRMS